MPADVHGAELLCWQVQRWCEVPGLVHGFLGRTGGVSRGPFASLNAGDHVGDEPALVAANRQRIEGFFAGIRIRTMRQVHGCEVRRIDTAQEPVGAADGLVTRLRGIGLAVLTADCVPILLFAPAAGLLAVVHAGWRGTVAGVASRAVEVLCESGNVRPTEIEAALGPAIGGCCYEVESHIGIELESRWGAMPEAWQSSGSHGQLDLRAANRAILAGSGLVPERIEIVGPCTRCNPAQLYSHRGSSGSTGRQLSLIGWSVRTE